MASAATAVQLGGTVPSSARWPCQVARGFTDFTIITSGSGSPLLSISFTPVSRVVWAITTSVTFYSTIGTALVQALLTISPADETGLSSAGEQGYSTTGYRRSLVFETQFRLSPATTYRCTLSLINFDTGGSAVTAVGTPWSTSLFGRVLGTW